MYVGSEVLLDGDSGFFLFFLFWLFGSSVRDAPTPSPLSPKKRKGPKGGWELNVVYNIETEI